jgi:hypothetical protein
MALTTKPKSGAKAKYLADAAKKISTPSKSADFNDKPHITYEDPSFPTSFTTKKVLKVPHFPRPPKKPVDLDLAPKKSPRPPPRPQKNPMTGNLESQKETQERLDSYSDYYKKGGVVKKAMGGTVRGTGCATRGITGAKQY